MKKILNLSLSLLLLVVVLGTFSCSEDNIYKSGEITDTSKEVNIGSVITEDIFDEVTNDELVYIEGEQYFYLGAQATDFYLPNFNANATSDDRQLERVFMKNYYIGRYEVTQGLWNYVMDYEGKNYLGEDMTPYEWDASTLTEEVGLGDLYPIYVENSTDVSIFLNRLNMILGEDYRLPTSDEWEYAARGGKQTLKNSYPGANDVDLVAWYHENSGNKLHPVGKKATNELSLYDMAGNVAEYSETDDVLGGSYLTKEEDCRVSLRKTTEAAIGFRLALTPAEYFTVKSNSDNSAIAEATVNKSSEEITLREGKKAVFETALVAQKKGDDPNIYMFDGWYNGDERVSRDSKYTVVVEDNITLTAKYKKVNYIAAYVEINLEKAGSVTINGLTGVQYIPKGEDVVLVAETNNGYVFEGWYKGTEKLSNESSYTINNVDKDIDYIQAKFLPLYNVSIKANWSSGGQITINEIASKSIQVKEGGSATFKVEVNDGYVFDGWYNGSYKLSSELTYTFQNVTTDLSFTAKFKRLFEVEVVADPIIGGTATVNNSSDEQIIVEGEFATFKAKASEGYVFAGWYNNGYYVSSDLEYKVKVEENIFMTAKFKPTFKVSVESSVGGSATLNGSTNEQIITQGEYVIFKAVAEEGYIFDGWYNGTIRVSKQLEYLYEVDKDLKLTAMFKENNGTYSVLLNNEWRLSSISNPNYAEYDGVYESYSNYHINNGTAYMYIDIEGYETFQIYVRSNAESTFDYIMVSQLDRSISSTSSSSSSVKYTTSGRQSSDTSIDGYDLVEFTNIDGGHHRITILYKKDGSVNSGADRGYVLIPKNQ